MSVSPPSNQQPATSNRAYWLASAFSVAWFALWLSAFRPFPEPEFQPEPRPVAAVCPAADEALSRLRAPTLFALPSKEGFSGTFPEKQVNVRPSLERPHQPETYLTRQPAAAPAPDQTKLIESIPLPQNELPAPGATPTEVIRNPEKIVFFFSPGLQPRAADIEVPAEIETLPEASVRIHLTVRPDGTVEHAFFETPTKQPALLSAVRKLHFSPTPKTTDGWLDIRFTPPKEKPGENS